MGTAASGSLALVAGFVTKGLSLSLIKDSEVFVSECEFSSPLRCVTKIRIVRLRIHPLTEIKGLVTINCPDKVSYIMIPETIKVFVLKKRRMSAKIMHN